MNYIDLGKEEVVIVGEEEIIMTLAQFKILSKGIVEGEDVKLPDVSVDVGDTEIYFYNNETEIMVLRSQALEVIELL